MTEQSGIVRTWSGVIRTPDTDRYVAYVVETGVKEYRATEGNRGASVLTRDLGDGRTRITTISRWDSLDSIVGFAGDDIEQAVFYPEDDEYLLERDTRVEHHIEWSR